MRQTLIMYILQFPFFLVGCGCDHGSEQSQMPKPSAGTTIPQVYSDERMNAATQPQAIWNRKSTMINHFPDISEIHDIRLVKGLNASKGGMLNEELLKRLLASAKPIDDSDSAQDQWSYAPWYSGSFVVPKGTFCFEIYLGNRGKLVGPDRQVFLFSFDQPSQINGSRRH
ncbi:MAG: hypothetical protein IT446_04795 [Phycisphaerales bacterium]|nr:hypothetical protein [Phycisphaerales bacterium]